MAAYGLSSVTVRPRNSWFFTITEIAGNYEFSIGYKYADGSISYFSPAKRNAPVKPPWDPPVTCQYLVLKRNDMSVDAFRFTSPTGVSRDFSISFLQPAGW